MKVLSVIEKTYERDGETKKFYDCAVQKSDGTTIGASSFELLKIGDEIAEDRLHPGKKEGTWSIWSEKKGFGGGKYQRNDDLIISQVAMKMVVELALGGMIDPPLTSQTLVNNGILIANAIKDVAAALKGEVKTGVKVEGKPETEPENKAPDIRTIGVLLKRAAGYQLSTQDVCEILGVSNAADIRDFDAAWAIIKGQMEPK